MTQAPGVQQGVGRAGVESAHRAVARQQGVVADPAQVEHRAVFIGVLQQRGMEGRDQGRAVATGGDIAAAEVGHGGDAGAFGDHAAVADLHRERRIAVRVVAQGLAVRADCGDLRGRDTSFVQQRQRRVGEGLRDLHVQATQFVQCLRFATLADRDQALAQVAGPWPGAGCAQAQSTSTGVIGELHQRRVDAVGAGAGDQAKEESGHPRRLAQGDGPYPAPTASWPWRCRRGRTSVVPSTPSAPGLARWRP